MEPVRKFGPFFIDGFYKEKRSFGGQEVIMSLKKPRIEPTLRLIEFPEFEPFCQFVDSLPEIAKEMYLKGDGYELQKVDYNKYLFSPIRREYMLMFQFWLRDDSDYINDVDMYGIRCFSGPLRYRKMCKIISRNFEGMDMASIVVDTDFLLDTEDWVKGYNLIGYHLTGPFNAGIINYFMRVWNNGWVPVSHMNLFKPFCVAAKAEFEILEIERLFNFPKLRNNKNKSVKNVVFENDDLLRNIFSFLFVSYLTKI